jgi:hypothetical protein
MNLTKSLVCSLVVVVSLACTPSLFAQGTDLGTIRGLVTDASGAAVPGAKVVVLDVSTGTTRQTTANSQGDYQIFGLRPGSYKVSVSVPDMRTTDLTGIVLRGSDVVSANAVLKVASKQEAIEVTAIVPVIDTADQTISDTITSRAVIDLPRDSRDVYSVLISIPTSRKVGRREFKFLWPLSWREFHTGRATLQWRRFRWPTNSKPSLEAVARHQRTVE